MATHGRGLICLALTERALRRSSRCARWPSTTTSAIRHRVHRVDRGAPRRHDRHLGARPRAHDPASRSIPTSSAADIVPPGHVFPLRARPGGVLQRTGPHRGRRRPRAPRRAEPAGVICEIMSDDGTMARVPDLIEFCRQHDLALVSVADLIEYRRQQEHLVERVGRPSRLPTAYGEFTAVSFREVLTGKLHLALVRGEVAGAEDVLVRVHSRVRDRRRLPLAALRLRRAARDRAAPHRRRGARRAALPRAGGPRHRAAGQAGGLRAAGAGARHGRREPRARPAGGRARVRHRRADPRRSSASRRSAS